MISKIINYQDSTVNSVHAVDDQNSIGNVESLPNQRRFQQWKDEVQDRDETALLGPSGDQTSSKPSPKPGRGKRPKGYAKTGYIFTYPRRNSMVWLREHPQAFVFLLTAGLMTKWKPGSEKYWRITPKLRGKLPKVKTKSQLQAVVETLVGKGYLTAQENGPDLLVALTDLCPISFGVKPDEKKFIPIERSDAQILSMLAEPNRFCLWYHVRARGGRWEGNACKKRVGRFSMPGLTPKQYRLALIKCEEAGLFKKSTTVPGRGTDLVCEKVTCYTKDDLDRARDTKIIQYAGDSKIYPGEVKFDADLLSDQNLLPDQKGLKKGREKGDEKDREKGHVLRRKPKKVNSKNEIFKKEKPIPPNPPNAGGDEVFIFEENDSPGEPTVAADVDTDEPALDEYTRLPDYDQAFQKVQELQKTLDELESELDLCLNDLKNEQLYHKANPGKHLEQLRAKSIMTTNRYITAADQKGVSPKVLKQYEEEYLANLDELRIALENGDPKSPDYIKAEEAYHAAEEKGSEASDALYEAKVEWERQQAIDCERKLYRTPKQARDDIKKSGRVEIEDLLVLIPCMKEIRESQPDDPERADKLLGMICSVYNLRLEKGSHDINWSTQQKHWESAIIEFRALHIPASSTVSWTGCLRDIVSDHIDASRYAFDWKAFKMFYEVIEMDLIVDNYGCDSGEDLGFDEIEKLQKDSEKLHETYKRFLRIPM
jgi:hypothetical protein